MKKLFENALRNREVIISEKSVDSLIHEYKLIGKLPPESSEYMKYKKKLLLMEIIHKGGFRKLFGIKQKY